MNKRFALILLASVFGWTVTLGGCIPQKSPIAGPSTPAVEAPVAEVPATGSVSSDSAKCEWLRANFPQTTEGIQALGAKLAGVEKERVRTHVYRCTPTTTVFDGMIFSGPDQGFNGSFTISVPVNGAVDSYAEATYTGRHELLGAATDTTRAFDGKVTAVTATYWPWLDENPPVTGGISASQPIANATCTDPKVLAAQHGWTSTGSPDKYGGLVVTLASSDVLPVDWEAIGPAGSIMEFDTNRTMSAVTYTVYPPFSCREQLGYSQ